MEEVFVPVIVIGELYFGSYKSSDSEQNIRRINRFLQNCIPLAADSDTALYYGKIKAALHQKGKPIPENDIWIAATAQQYGLPLFTTDKHFSEVESIALF